MIMGEVARACSFCNGDRKPDARMFGSLRVAKAVKEMKHPRGHYIRDRDDLMIWPHFVKTIEELRLAPATTIEISLVIFAATKMLLTP